MRCRSSSGRVLEQVRSRHWVRVLARFALEWPPVATGLIVLGRHSSHLRNGEPDGGDLEHRRAGHLVAAALDLAFPGAATPTLEANTRDRSPKESADACGVKARRPPVVGRGELGALPVWTGFFERNREEFRHRRLDPAREASFGLPNGYRA